MNLILDHSGVTVTPAGFPDDHLRGFLNDSVLREYPEIESYFRREDNQSTEDGNSNHDDWVTETPRVGSAKITVHYDPEGPRRQLIKLIERAVLIVQAAGFRVPDFVVHLPKYARELNLEVRYDAATGTEELVISPEGEPSLNALAQFFAPNVIIISPELLAPLDPDRRVRQNPYGLDDYFDEKAVATIVHELGHLLHNDQNSHIVTQLWNTALRAPNVRTLLRAVSPYASEGDSIEEFVAEYFLGLVFERVYPDEVSTRLSALYEDLGGPVPHLRRRTIDSTIDPEKLSVLTRRVNMVLHGRGDRRTVTERIVANYHAQLTPYARRLVLRDRAIPIVDLLQNRPTTLAVGP